MRAQRHWRIVERFDRFYVENQYGGFAGWNTTLEDAIAQGRRYVAEDGDTFEDPTVKDSPERCSLRCGAPVEECARDHVEQRDECGGCGRQVMRYGTDGIWFDPNGSNGYACAGGSLHDPKRQSGRDWRTMTPADFDTDVDPGTLFDLEPGQVPAVDPCGTGDLLEEIR